MEMRLRGEDAFPFPILSYGNREEERVIAPSKSHGDRRRTFDEEE